MGDNNNLIGESDAEPRDDLKDEVGGTFGLVNFVFQFVGFFAFLLKSVITEFAKIFNKK